jgi:FkbM family methyltransferase
MQLRHWLQGQLRGRGIHIERARDPFTDQALLLNGRAQTIIDGGANEGQTSIAYKKVFPRARIYSFEPSPSLYMRLCQNHGNETVPVQLALSDENCGAKFFEYDLNGYNSFEKCTVDIATKTAEILVQTTTVDNFCAANNIEVIDILKLDIQGAELKALHGASRMLSERRVRLVYAEVHFSAIYERQCFYHEIASFLADYDLPLFRFYDLHYTKDRRLEYTDAIFCSASL